MKVIREMKNLKNDNGDIEGIIGVIIFIILLCLILFLIAPAFCQAMPATPEGWGPDYCSIFR